LYDPRHIGNGKNEPGKKKNGEKEEKTCEKRLLLGSADRGNKQTQTQR